MKSFIQRASTAECFFCQSSVPAADPQSFRCPQCSCWNRYDANGNILSDDPAMHNEDLNTKSFARRASPNKNRFPSTYSTGQFCHTCQTNQMLLVNLLSNYLPPPQHSDYATRVEQLPAYRESLHKRYPPVCALCLPAVEDEIRRKDHMARTQALGGFLRDTKGKDRQRQVSGTGKDRENLESQLAIWRLRGTLWSITFLCTVACHSAVVLEYNLPPLLERAAPSLPAIVCLSLFYTAWDPTYYSFKRARTQGRDVRVRGKGRYIILQLIAWFSRLVTSVLLALPRYHLGRDHRYSSFYPGSYRFRIYCSASLALEITIFIISFAILHLQRPPSIRLIETSPPNHLQSSSSRATPELAKTTTTSTGRSSSVPAFPTYAEPDFTALTLSSKPVAPSPSNPVFGIPSLLSTAVPNGSPIKVDDDAMDWSPTDLSSEFKHKLGQKSINDEDSLWLRPQRFFPPEQPTGLEALFAGTKLDDGDGKAANSAKTSAWIWKREGATGVLYTFWRWLGVTAVVLVPLCAIAYRGWTVWNTVSTDGHILRRDY